MRWNENSAPLNPENGEVKQIRIVFWQSEKERDEQIERITEPRNLLWRGSATAISTFKCFDGGFCAVVWFIPLRRERRMGFKSHF
jgi:hypothetical protein